MTVFETVEKKGEKIMRKKYDIYEEGPFGERDPRFIGRRIRRNLPDGTQVVSYKKRIYAVDWDADINGYMIRYKITE